MRRVVMISCLRPLLRCGYAERVDSDTDKKKKHFAPTTSAILDDGSLVELVFQPGQRSTCLAVYSAGRWTMQEDVDLDGVTRLVPFSPENNLIKNDAVLLSSEPRIYGTEEQLVSDVQQFIHRYVDLSPIFEQVATYYLMFPFCGRRLIAK
jgi:hypothetical protein